jgi:hypothetical protein
MGAKNNNTERGMIKTSMVEIIVPILPFTYFKNSFEIKPPNGRG